MSFLKRRKNDNDSLRSSSSNIIFPAPKLKPRFGLRFIDCNAVDPEISIIAIDGFQKDESEWGFTNWEDGRLWLEVLFYPSAVFRYSYDSKSDFTLKQHADWLLDSIVQENRVVGEIIFLAKDVGGMILCEAIYRALGHGVVYSKFLGRIIGIIYFNTPHSGSKTFRILRYSNWLAPASDRKMRKLLGQGNSKDANDALAEVYKSTIIVNAYSVKNLSSESQHLFYESDFGRYYNQLVPMSLSPAMITSYQDPDDQNFIRIRNLINRIPEMHRELTQNRGKVASRQVDTEEHHELPTSTNDGPAKTEHPTRKPDDVNTAIELAADSDFESAKSLQLNPDFLSKLGLFQLSANLQVLPKIDIVAVHSVKGHYLHSWQAHTNDKVWIRDFLEDDMREARVFSFGWNADLFENSKADLRDVATQLNVRLDTVRQSEHARKRPLLFLGHGVGGILVKQALIMANEDPQYAPIFTGCKGIFFFATPHGGIDPEQYSRALGADNVAVDSDHAFIKSLARNSDTIEELSFRFRNLVERISIVNFYELFAYTLGTDDRVVSRSDATMNLARERQIPINATHERICRFESQKDSNYRIVVEEIIRLAETTYT